MQLLRVEADLAPFFLLPNYLHQGGYVFVFWVFYEHVFFKKKKKSKAELMKYDELLHLHGITHCACQGGVVHIYNL